MIAISFKMKVQFNQKNFSGLVSELFSIVEVATKEEARLKPKMRPCIIRSGWRVGAVHFS